MGDKDANLGYDEMHDAGDHLISEHERIEKDLDKLKDYVDDLVEDGFKTKHASKAFQEEYDDFTQGLKQMMDGLQGMGNYLHKASDAFEDTDKANEEAARGN